MAKSGSIIYQTKKRFRELDAIGTKKGKHQDNLIHSIGTMKTYLSHGLKFAEYCRKKYKCKTLDECKAYVKEYIESNDYSPWVKKAQRSALAKMYQVRGNKFGKIDTGERSRETVKRSRGEAVRDKHFSENGKYKDYVRFCRATGLRKVEMEKLTGDAFYRDKNGKAWLNVTKWTKGGRFRKVLVLEEDAKFVENFCLQAKDKRVLPFVAANRIKAPNGADTHSYRGDYVASLYNKLKRPLDDLGTKEKYFCRKELKGIVYDREAMRFISHCLGHSRVSIVAESYLHALS